MGKSPEDLVEECRERQSEQQSRISNYSRFSDAYFGEISEEGSAAMDTTGRPILRMSGIRNDLANRPGAPNFISPIVDDFIALRGIIPLIKVLPADEKEESRLMSLKRTRVIRGCWDNSNMTVQQPNGAFFLSGLGDCPYVLDPLLPKDADDLNPPGIYITVYNPRMAYPKFRSGRWSEELEDLYIVWESDGETIKNDFGVDLEDDDETGEVILYYSRQEKRTLINGKPAPTGNVNHKLGWCPAQWVRNKMVGGRFAQADIAQSIDLSKELQIMFGVMNDATIESVYSPIMIRNPSKIGGDTIEIGPRSVITVEDDGDVSRIPPSPAPTSATQIMQTMQSALYHTTGTVPVRTEGQIDKSNTSGRAVHAVQGPMETRLGLSNAVVGYHFERLTQKMLLMYGRIPELASAQMTLTGSEKGKSFTVEFTGEEIGGSSKVQIKWDSKIGTTQHERLTMALQAYSQGLVPGTFVIEQLDEDDPEMILEQAMNEKLSMAKHQQEIQAAMQPQGGDPGQNQAQIQQPQDQANALQGGSVAGGPQPSGPPGGGGPNPPSGAGSPPGQSPSSSPQQGGGGLPPFPKGDPAGQKGLGPPPQIPNFRSQVNDILHGLPPAAEASIMDVSVSEKGVEVIVDSWKAISVIRKAFKEAGIKAVVTESHGATA